MCSDQKDFDKNNRDTLKKLNFYLRFDENHRSKFSESISSQIKLLETEVTTRDLDFRVSRGEIWLVDLGINCGNELNKERPCIIVSYDEYNNRSGLVTLVPITRARYSHNTQFLITDDCIDEIQTSLEGTAKSEQITTKSKYRLKSRLGKLSDIGMQKLESTLLNHFCLQHCCSEDALKNINNLNKELHYSKENRESPEDTSLADEK